MANVDNTKSQMRKGMLEYCIMLLLHHQPSYANDIIGRLKEAEMIVVEGTLYPLLNRLKKDGLLKYEWQESTQGPPRKYYALTEEGEEALVQLDSSWSEIATTVTILRNNFPALPSNTQTYPDCKSRAGVVAAAMSLSVAAPGRDSRITDQNKTILQ